MNPELTKLIERYLNGELTSTEKAEFEQKMNSNEVLRKEVELQRMIHEAAKRLSLRAHIKSTGKTYHLLRKAIIAGIVTLSIAIGTGVIYLITKKSSKELTLDEQETLHTLLDKNAPIENLKTHYFQWKGNDTVFVSPNGVLLSVPKNAYKHAKGETMTLQYQEAMDIQDIVKSGLSTMSGDQLLETQGMFGIQAFNNKGKRLDINPEVGVYVQVPVDEVKKGMLLFEGKKTKDGIIDWQNPTKLEKLPILAKMSDLNFYPPGYEDTLNNIKARRDKKYRDSLYLSMEEFLGNESNEIKLYVNEIEATSDKQLLQKTSNLNFKNECTKLIKDRIVKGLNSELTSKKFFNESSIETFTDTLTENGQFIINTVILGNNFGYIDINNIRINNKKLNNVNISVIEIGNRSIGIHFQILTPLNELKKDFRYKMNLYSFELKKVTPVDYQKTYVFSSINAFENDSIPFNNAIPPSKVLAFWNKKFDKTNLATRDFEKRMRVIHKTCDPKLLELYTKNLNKALWELDEQAVRMGYKEFQAFADEHVGKVELSNAHQSNLSTYYEQLTADLRKDAQEELSFRLKKENEWDKETNDKRIKNQVENTTRETKNLREETEVNMESVYKQLGKKRPEYSAVAGPSVGFQIRTNVAVHNIDAFVREQTFKRESGTFFDKDSGKTAKIIYNKLKIKVQEKGYERLYVYLFPSKLSSFHRLTPVGKNAFEYTLNQEMQYDLAIVGFKEDGYYFYSKTMIPARDLGEIELEKVSETKLNASLESLNHSRYMKNDDISEEIAFLISEQKDYVVQKQRQKNQLFRERIRKVVFPCFSPKSEYIPSKIVEELESYNL